MIHSTSKSALPIPDATGTVVTDSLTVDESLYITSVEVSVDITHPYIGDLSVSLRKHGELDSVELHAPGVDGTDDLKRTFDLTTTPGLASFLGLNAKDVWSLEIQDIAGRDEGALKRWSLEIEGTDHAPVTLFDQPDLTIPDDPNGVEQGLLVDESFVARKAKVMAVAVSVDIAHAFIGDLVVSLISPQGTRVILHDRIGGAADALQTTYVAASLPDLDVLANEPAFGEWALRIQDLEGKDAGTLNQWSLTIFPDTPISSAYEETMSESTIRLRKDMLPGKSIAGELFETISIIEEFFTSDVKIHVDIRDMSAQHLQVRLHPPELPGGGFIGAILHNEPSDDINRLSRTYDLSNRPELGDFLGRSAKGDWTLVAGTGVEGRGVLASWSLQVDGKERAPFADGGNANLLIPDNDGAGATITMTAPDAGKVDAVAVSVYLTHPNAGDLVVTLISPSGTAVTLLNRRNGNANSKAFVFTPKSLPALSNFRDEQVQGEWKLLVQDLRAGDSGMLAAHRLVVFIQP